MWSDNDTNIDLIDFNHLVSAIKGIIDNDKLVPRTIGIFGDWGSGKSSLMRMVEDSFRDEKDILTIGIVPSLYDNSVLSSFLGFL